MPRIPDETGPSVFFDLQDAPPEQVAETRKEFVGGLCGLLVRQGASVEKSDRVANEVWESMSSTDRHYHTPVHVLLILGQARRLGIELPARCSLAVWLHDHIFDTRAESGVNEAASADWVLERLPAIGIDEGLAKLAADSIRCTAQLLDPDVSSEHGWMLDMDLAGLGRERECFDKQSIAVRKELTHLDDEEYRAVNLSLFEALLARESIYRTKEFAPLEAMARANLERVCRDSRI